MLIDYIRETLVTKHTCHAAQQSDIDQIVSAWKAVLPLPKGLTLKSELKLDRPLYIVRTTVDDRVVAVFDVHLAREHNKNLKIFFSPDLAGHEGLTPQDIDAVDDLLVFVFNEMIFMAEAEEAVQGVKICSNDSILLAAFRGFAHNLKNQGYCSVKVYGSWIQIDELNLQTARAPDVQTTSA